MVIRLLLQAAYVAVMQRVTQSNRAGYDSLLRVYRESDQSEERNRVLGNIDFVYYFPHVEHLSLLDCGHNVSVCACRIISILSRSRHYTGSSQLFTDFRGILDFNYRLKGFYIFSESFRSY